LDDQSAQRLQIDKTVCEANWQLLRSADIQAKVQQVFNELSFTPSDDPEQQLYNGFLKDADKQTCERVRHASAQAFSEQQFVFQDARLNAMLLRYRARHFPESLSAEERGQWEEWRRERLVNPAYGAGITLEPFSARIAELRLTPISREQQQLLTDLECYAAGLVE